MNTVKGSARKGKRVTHSPKAHPSSAPSHAGGVPGGSAGGGMGKGAAQSNLRGSGSGVKGNV
jgi:hypothetical protein